MADTCGQVLLGSGLTVLSHPLMYIKVLVQVGLTQYAQNNSICMSGTAHALLSSSFDSMLITLASWVININLFNITSGTLVCSCGVDLFTRIKVLVIIVWLVGCFTRVIDRCLSSVWVNALKGQPVRFVGNHYYSILLNIHTASTILMCHVSPEIKARSIFTPVTRAI